MMAYGGAKMITLDEAISHAREVGTKMVCKHDTCECGKEHLQLAKWLEELKTYRAHYDLPHTDSLRHI